jgi:hypothetical protein
LVPISAETGENTIKVSMSLSQDEAYAGAQGVVSEVVTTHESIPTLTDFRIGRWANTTQLNGHIRKIAFYPVMLTSAETQTITEE